MKDYLFNKKTIYYSLLFSFIIIMGGYLLIVYLYPSTTNDSGYYLKIAYDLAHGLSFFKELNCSYSPLVMYILSVPFYFNNDIGLTFLFTYAFAIFPLIGILFFQILKFYNSNNEECFFLTILLITANFVFEGFHILLEPYVLLFQLIAIWLLLKWKLKKGTLFLVGVFTFLAFYAKQYGLFIMPALMFWIYKESKNIKLSAFNFSFLILGFFVPILILVSYFYTYENIPVKVFLLKLFGIQALKGNEIVTGIDYSVIGVFKKVGQFVIDFPFIIVVVILFFGTKIKSISNNSWFALLLLLGAFCTLYFAYYSHYFQLIIPYVIISIVTFSKGLIEKKYIILLFSSTVFLVGASLKLKNKFVEKKEHYNEQLTNIPILKSNISSKNVYLHGISPAYYFLCKYNSPNYAALGYKFPSELTLNDISRKLSEGDCILIEPKFFEQKIFDSYIKKSEFTVIDGVKRKSVLLLEKK
ncbi:hypothetical protein [Flavivirga spongiicola]|uniref:Glycosyltransferase RgtA/B/C/D-like domain-containing protein n=1 Tax=Flavivirga spongiicola TaxID=421621 RepID=A0ABU7XP47_9FLAO|nr:hypothetical protein [Flavivirga sp. MEBiC05379]MDO5977539.1 hypothetical protein [Flavivirga sp. MEBiC05379]